MADEDTNPPDFDPRTEFAGFDPTGSDARPSDQPPLPLDYRGWTPMEPPEYRPQPVASSKPGLHPAYHFLRFYGGFALGVLASVIVWIFNWEGIFNSRATILAILCAKILTGIGYIFVPRWRLFGAGIITSIALGILIFGAMFALDVAKAITTSTCHW